MIVFEEEKDRFGVSWSLQPMSYMTLTCTKKVMTRRNFIILNNILPITLCLIERAILCVKLFFSNNVANHAYLLRSHYVTANTGLSKRG